MLAGFRRHLVDKTLINVCHCDVASPDVYSGGPLKRVKVSKRKRATMPEVLHPHHRCRRRRRQNLVCPGPHHRFDVNRQLYLVLHVSRLCREPGTASVLRFLVFIADLWTRFSSGSAHASRRLARPLGIQWFRLVAGAHVSTTRRHTSRVVSDDYAAVSGYLA